jgi:hypothetical protein
MRDRRLPRDLNDVFVARAPFQDQRARNLTKCGPSRQIALSRRASDQSKKLALATAAVLALLSIAGCGGYVGKGKAPPPVVTKG